MLTGLIQRNFCNRNSWRGHLIVFFLDLPYLIKECKISLRVALIDRADYTEGIANDALKVFFVQLRFLPEVAKLFTDIYF
jgi:hypothetical protein